MGDQRAGGGAVGSGDGSIPPDPSWQAGAGASQTELDLRPKGVGEILDTAQRLYRSHWKSLIAIVAVVTVPFWFITTGIQLAAPTLVQNTQPGELNISGGTLAAVAGFGVIGFIVGWIAQTLESAAMARATADIYLGDPPSIADSYRRALDRLGTLLAIAVLTGLAVIGGFILLIIPAIIFGLRFYFGTVVAIVEGDENSATDAMRRSWRLVKGRSWPVFGTLILVAIIVLVGQAILALPFQLFRLFGDTIGTVGVSVGNLIAGLLLAPFAAAAGVVLYFDLRIRKEGFDLEVMARELASGAGSGTAPTSRPETGPGTGHGTDPTSDEGYTWGPPEERS